MNRMDGQPTDPKPVQTSANETMRWLWATLFTLAIVLFLPSARAEMPENHVAGRLIQLSDDGAWSWFMDERVIVQSGKLIVGSVRSKGAGMTSSDREDSGSLEISVYDLASETIQKTTLHRNFGADDHNSPALLALPDGRTLAVYQKHHRDRDIYFRHTRESNPLVWGEAGVFSIPAPDPLPRRHRVTYANPVRTQSGRIYNFFRGDRLNPHYMYSDDEGKDWHYAGQLLTGPGNRNLYLKYALAPPGRIHFVATEDHPGNFDTSLYHGTFEDQVVRDSAGKLLADLGGSLRSPVEANDLTLVYRGGPDHPAWMADLEVDRDGRPWVAFSVQVDGRDRPPGSAGMDLRYHYGRWHGAAWATYEMAHAGTRLYATEDDYAGLVALDPMNPNVVYISTNSDPVSGHPLISRADQKRHHEIFRGTTKDSGATWSWQPVTANSKLDNLRPCVPRWDDARTALVWMRGTYTSTRGIWRSAIVALILPAAARSGSGDALP